MHIFRTLSFGLLAGLALVGCGGSGSGVTSGYGGEVSTKGDLPAGPGFDGGSTMKMLASGDTWRYSVKGTVTRDYFDAGNNKRTTSGPVTNGQMIRVVADDTLDGMPVLRLTDTLTYTPQGGTPVVQIWQRYVRQGSDGTLYLMGERGDNLLYSNGQAIPYAQGTFGVNQNAAGSTTFSYGSAARTDIQTSVTALGMQSVATSTGAPYTAWRGQFSQSEHLVNDARQLIVADQAFLKIGFVVESTRQLSTIDDWCPSIGAPVSTHLQYNGADTVVKNYTFTAASGTSPATFTYTYDNFNTVMDLNLSLQSRNF